MDIALQRCPLRVLITGGPVLSILPWEKIEMWPLRRHFLCSGVWISVFEQSPLHSIQLCAMHFISVVTKKTLIWECHLVTLQILLANQAAYTSKYWTAGLLPQKRYKVIRKESRAQESSSVFGFLVSSASNVHTLYNVQFFADTHLVWKLTKGGVRMMI